MRPILLACRSRKREQSGEGFSYLKSNGEPVRDAATLERIRKLAIPPAWTDVWICPKANGHIQATGRDARGRKQYKYHPQFREVREGTKYEHMMEFARALPAIRARLAEHMALRGLPREKVVDGSELRFQFKGKSGKTWRLQVKDRRVAKIVKACQELPGQELFQYVDETGELKDVTSADVNAYLKEITGLDITAKDFRTWAGTVLAALALREFERFDTQAGVKKNIRTAIERVASRLGNTPTICRKCYVHPEVLSAYAEGALLLEIKDRVEAELRDDLAALKPEEAAVLGLLEARLNRTLADALKDSLALKR